MRRILRAILRPPLMAVGAVVMFVEEVLWEGLKRLMALVGRLPLVRSLEARISGLPPYGAAVVFLLPGSLLLPVKLTALWLMATGHVLLGFQFIIAAKLIGMALVARIFVLTKPQLMRLVWFAAMHDWIMHWRDKLYGWVKTSAVWRQLESARAAIRAWLLHRREQRNAQRFAGKLPEKGERPWT